ncbi:MAG: 4Fe-4S dicluster domain-containing protein [Planctomycetes bacterium]|nr:4Fe-4S dicluster domain-containing protein [Planctomycetota bacterium]
MTSADRHVSYAPTDGLTYDPSDARYWDEGALAGEVARAFDICHGCRMCFKYCDSFPTLFKFVDEVHEGDVRKLDASETERVMDACFQCKLCEVQCPYTPRDGHAFQLDFPKLVHRFKAVRGKQQGFTLRDRVLGDPGAAGRMARMSLGMANVMNRVSAHRWFMEKVLGIDRRKELPEFASSTFEKWAAADGRMTGDTSAEAVLFPTCYVQNNEPQIGRDTLEVLDRNQVRTTCVRGLECCGMPAWEHGDLEGLRKHAHQNLDTLMPYVEAGAKVLAVNPTCSMMMRREYPELLEGEDRERARRLAASVMDPSEYLWSIRDEPRFDTAVKTKPAGPIAYHAPCHLRAQAVGFKARDLFKKLLGARVVPVIECCGHDGTYAMTVEGFEPAQRAGQNAFREMKGAGASTWSTDCPLAAIQFHQFAGVKPAHPMSILARAYRGEPFPEANTAGGDA